MSELRHDQQELSLDRLERATILAARIVHQFGNAYWPVFDRLDKELTERKQRAGRLARYLGPDT